MLSFSEKEEVCAYIKYVPVTSQQNVAKHFSFCAVW